jgi:hypothetical protein
MNPVCRQLFFAADGVGPAAVAAVDDDVATIEQRPQLARHRVDRRTRLDHHDDAARPCDALHERTQGRAADETPGRIRMLRDEATHHVRLEIVARDTETVVRHVQREVASHDGQADHADVGVGPALAAGHVELLRVVP